TLWQAAQAGLRCILEIFFFQAEDGIRGGHVTGVQTCALPIYGFGTALVAVGGNLLIGSPGDDSAGLDAGAAYLFDPGTAVVVKRSEERRVGKEGRCVWGA